MGKSCQNCGHNQEPAGVQCFECKPGFSDWIPSPDAIRLTKPPLSHILRFPNAITGLAELLEHGAQKHGGFFDGKASTELNTTADSLLRHLTALLNGQETDHDSGKSHRHHLLANALFIAEHRPEDRPDE